MDNQQPSDNSLFYKKPHKGMGFVYKYTSPSGKNYIGQTINSLADRAKSIKKLLSEMENLRDIIGELLKVQRLSAHKTPWDSARHLEKR